MFYDVPNPNRFLEDVKKVLDKEGIFVLEHADLLSIIKNCQFDTICHEHLEYYSLKSLKYLLDKAGLKIDLMRPYPPATGGNAAQNITLRHKEFGSEHTFQAASNTAGLVSNVANVSVVVANGTDVAGEINGEEAYGKGQNLTGAPGADTASGIQIRYTGESAPVGGKAGTVTFSQNSLTFQVGADANQFSEAVSYTHLTLPTKRIV